jgi:alpha-tubulin suppressor-like RCC1 family protein
VKCWGNNDSGQLGDGTTNQHLTPMDVIGLSSGVRAISAGTYHTCALTIAGGVKCWGANFYGQLGDNTTSQRVAPVDVVGLSNEPIAISIGMFDTCVETNAGGVKCWGYNYYGQLGDYTTINRWTPVDVVGLNNAVTAISVGYEHVCAVTGVGGVKCWGLNDNGQLGENTTTTRWTSVDVIWP